MRWKQTILLLGLVCGLQWFALPERTLAQGTWLSSAGPVHRGMGGASTAAPLDAIGAMYWNPATISGLERNELGVGLDLLYSDHTISSSIGPLSGATESENGFMPIPTVGWAHHLPDQNMTLGLFIGGVAGFKTTVRADPFNPAIAPLGRISSEAAFFQIAPAVSMAVTERLALSAGPTITLGQVEAEPFIFDTPNVDGQYPSGRASRYHWGGGAQFGAYYILDAIHFGVSLKTPTWMEGFRFFGTDAAGGPRVLHADIDLPLILSFGTAYTGIERWELAADIRYFDYENTDGFGDAAAFDATGRSPGLGWKSVVAVALGAQYQLAEFVYVRGGYTYNDSPIDGDVTMFNLASPLMYEHMLSGGASLVLSENVSANFAYSYVFSSEVSGPIVFPGIGAIPGTSISQEMDAHVVNFGLSARY